MKAYEFFRIRSIKLRRHRAADGKLPSSEPFRLAPGLLIFCRVNYKFRNKLVIIEKHSYREMSGLMRERGADEFFRNFLINALWIWRADSFVSAFNGNSKI